VERLLTRKVGPALSAPDAECQHDLGQAHEQGKEAEGQLVVDQMACSINLTSRAWYRVKPPTWLTASIRTIGDPARAPMNGIGRDRLLERQDWST
jgi:hypothetical protein